MYPSSHLTRHTNTWLNFHVPQPTSYQTYQDTAQLPCTPAHILPDTLRHSLTSMYSSPHLTRHTNTQFNFHVPQPISYQTYQDTAQLPCNPALILPDTLIHSSTSMYLSPYLTRHTNIQLNFHVPQPTSYQTH